MPDVQPSSTQRNVVWFGFVLTIFLVVLLIGFWVQNEELRSGWSECQGNQVSVVGLDAIDFDKFGECLEQKDTKVFLSNDSFSLAQLDVLALNGFELPVRLQNFCSIEEDANGSSCFWDYNLGIVPSWRFGEEEFAGILSLSYLAQKSGCILEAKK